MKKILGYFLAFGLFLIPPCFIIDLMVTDLDFYHDQQVRLETSQKTGLDQAQIDELMELVVGYVVDDYDNLDYQLKIDGENQEAFNTREKEHMVDVKALYNNFKMFTYVLTGLWVIVFLVFFFKYQDISLMINYYNKVSIVIVGAIALIILYAMLDFAAFWTFFHQVLFTNDLWLLDPRTDLLINLLELELFSALVFQVIIFVVGYVVVSNITAFLYNGKWFKR